MKKQISKYRFCFLVIVYLSSVIYAAATYHGNSKSHVFHRAGCRYYNCKNCTVVFSSRSAAINSGYRPCKVCKP